MDKNIIYSDNFKRWFGDWENNPSESSKIVEDNGFPMLVYHGSESVFNEFKSEFMGKTGTACGQGFYFTNDKSEASYFGNNVKTFFLNIRKPLSDESLTITSDMFRVLLDSIDKKQCDADADFGYGILSDYGDVDYYGRESVLNDAVEMEMSSNDNDVELIGGIVNATNDYELVMQTLRDTLGYDGVIIKSRGIFVAHHPNQIKEYTNTKFNSNSNNMYENRNRKIFVTEKQISQIIGANFNKAFKPNNVLSSKIEALRTMTEIPEDYFENSLLKEIVIPDSVTSIGKGAFANCSNLTSITIPNKVTSIGEYAFYGCKSLNSVIIPDRVTSIGDGAFGCCINLTSVTIPNSVTKIGDGAFEWCERLTSVIIPDGVASIGEGAFYNCRGLKKVIAPSRFVNYFKVEYGIDIIPNDKGGMHESISRKIYITESQYKMLTENYNFIDAEKVLIVKKYLDKYFIRGSMNKVSDSGYAVKVGVIGMKNSDGEVIKNLTVLQMLDLLEDKFHYIYNDNEKRTKFLKQVLKDWCNKRISKEGLLSVNFY